MTLNRVASSFLRSHGLVVLAMLACGPGTNSDTGADASGGSGDDEGATTSADSTSATATDASASASGSGDASGSATADDGSGDDGSCPPNSVDVEPGCLPGPKGMPVPEAGCYEPCDQIGAACGVDGMCQEAWVNPCVCPEGEDCCAACGGESLLCLQRGATGQECMTDDDCASGVCWDFNDYDSCCGGTACSGTCRSDEDCVALATDAGAKSPEGATCGKDGRCSLVGSGIGSWACAGPPCG